MDILPTDLLGDWRFTRKLQDGNDGYGFAVGLLNLVATDGMVTWTETGTLTWQGNRVEVSRYLEVKRAADRWAVYFPDGRLFHIWSPGVSVLHLCGRDTYDGLIDVDLDLTSLRTRWQVHGPRKRQRIVTRYVRNHIPSRRRP